MKQQGMMKGQLYMAATAKSSISIDSRPIANERKQRVFGKVETVKRKPVFPSFDSLDLGWLSNV